LNKENNVVIRDIKEIIWSPGIKTKKCGFQGYKGNNVVIRDIKEIMWSPGI